MSVHATNHKFWLKWLVLAAIVFSLSFLLANRDSLFYKQWATPDLPSYEPFKINHFTLAIKQSDYDFFFSDRPESLYTYQRSEVSVNRTPIVIKAKMRIRGTHSWNWDPEKPSFRLKQRGAKKILARSNLNFAIADDPSMLANPIADLIATELGMPSPRTTFCTVTINGDYKGLYLLSEPINPETMTWQGLKNVATVEGNLRTSSMWENPELWKVQCDRTANQEEPFNCLTRLLKIVATPIDLTNLEKLPEVINIDKLASWSALMTAIGSIHANDFFGNSLLYDYSEKKLFPNITDSTGFGVLTATTLMQIAPPENIPPYEFLTPLLNGFFRIPEFQFKRNLALYKLLNQQLSGENLRNLVNRYLEILTPLFYREKYASALVNVPILNFPMKIPVATATQLADARRLLDFMDKRREYILTLLAKTSATIVTGRERTEINGRWFTHVAVKVSGHCPISWDFSGWQDRIIPDLNFDKVLDKNVAGFYRIQTFFPGLQEDRSESASFLQMQQRGANFVLTPADQTYVLGISEDHLQECLDFLTKQGHNSITGTNATLDYIPTTQAADQILEANSVVLHPWRKMADGKN